MFAAKFKKILNDINVNKKLEQFGSSRECV